MTSKLYETIRKYYLDGYGAPKKYYTETELMAFVKSGVITQQEMDEIIGAKAV